MYREDALDAFAIADSPDGEHLVQAVPTAANDDAGKNLDPFFIALDDFGVDPDTVAD
jgi:hypothetical protein